MVFPSFPLPSFNGVWADENVVPDDLEDALAEVEALGLQPGVQIRAGKMPTVRDAARRLGFTAEERVPGMVATKSDLRPPPETDVELIRVATPDGLAQALAVAAAGFGVPTELLAPLYLLEVAALDGLEYYLARLGNADVSTAIGYSIDDTAGIFNVATPPEFRGRGYGATITAHVASEALAHGADLTWLQSSPIGHSVYRRIGFRDVGTYVLYTAPEAAVDIPI